MIGDLEGLFPGLRDSGSEVTSPVDRGYNCIAWAAEDNTRWWWPDEFDQYYWPDGVPRRSTLEAFIQAFQILGYEVCNDSTFEERWEKVAIFAGENGVPTHAARQLPDGIWTSKLGRLEDITHPDVDHVGGAEYGKPELFLRRRTA